jgi:hypothetical protein
LAGLGLRRQQLVHGGAPCAYRAGANFIDTADVYGDGHSERLIARLKRERPAMKSGWLPRPADGCRSQTADGYTRDNLTDWIDRSRLNLETDTIDLLQLHCPHPDVYDRPEVFGMLDVLRGQGRDPATTASASRPSTKRAARSPSERADRANHLQHVPAETCRGFFAEAAAKDVGILARVPLASGLLTGKLDRQSRFADDDHRQFNRYGQQFDQGETFFRACPTRSGSKPSTRCAPRAGGHDAGAVRAALDPDVRRRDLRDSWCEDGPPRHATTSARPTFPRSTTHALGRHAHLRRPVRPSCPRPMVGNLS